MAVVGSGRPEQRRLCWSQQFNSASPQYPPEYDLSFTSEKAFLKDFSQSKDICLQSHVGEDE